MPESAIRAFDINILLPMQKAGLTPSQNILLGKLENSVTRGCKEQQIAANNQLAIFWERQCADFEPYNTIIYRGR